MPLPPRLPSVYVSDARSIRMRERLEALSSLLCHFCKIRACVICLSHVSNHLFSKLSGGFKEW